MSTFGDIFTNGDLEDAVTEVLRAWFPVYLPEVARQKELSEVFPAPRSYNVHPDEEKWLEDQLPAVIVVSPGIDGKPTKLGDGKITADWRVAVVVFVAGQDEHNCRRNAGVYAAAARAMLLQHRSLDGISNGISYEGETYDSSPTDQGRSIASGIVTFLFSIPGIVDQQGYPGVDAPTAETVSLGVVQKGVADEI